MILVLSVLLFVLQRILSIAKLMIYNFILYAVLWVDLLPILFYLILRKNKNKESHLLLLYPLFSAITQWGTYFFATTGISPIFLTNLYILILFLTLFTIFKRQLRSRLSDYIFYATGLFFLAMYVIDFKLEILMQKTLISSSIIYVLWSILGLVSILKTNEIKHQLNSTSTFFNIAILFYFSGSVILFFIFDMLNSSNYHIWTVHNILEIISKLIITYAFWKLPSKSIS